MTTDHPKQVQESRDDEGPVVVGIGASAGGLEALRPLVGHLPDATNMCYVITQHMAPKHKSLLDQLLSRETGLEVREAEDGDPVTANVIFVTPPGSDVVVRDGRLRLQSPQAVVGPKPSVDIFFTSLAEELGTRAIGIVLSGTGSDGSYGVRAIRAAGGVVIAQQPETAKYDGMPNAAIETGCVDLVMLPVEIAREISSIACFPRRPAEPEANLQGDQAIDMILKKLQQHTGVDFVNYKKTTIARRLDQRLATVRTKNLEEYYAYIIDHPGELDQLCKNILISVTAFFRDKQAFEALGEALKRLLAAKEPGDMLRIWVPGCATGEEPYSIAILLHEYLHQQINAYKIQIFATDIDEDALNVARRGMYSAASVGELEDGLIERCFIRNGNQYQIAKTVRDLVVFARQNLIQDPPFLRMDVITCRNLLIYFNTKLQDKAIRVFHYALIPGGHLLLGKSEAVSSYSDLFETVDSSAKLFRRKSGPRIAPPALAGSPMSSSGLYGSETLPRRSDPRETTFLDIVRAAALDAYVPICALLNERFELLHAHGDVSPFIVIKPGRVDLNILTMVIDDFRPELRALLHKARRDHTTLEGQAKKLTVNGETFYVRMRLHPVHSNREEADYFLVGFDKTPEPADIVALPPASGDEQDARIAELDQELIATREHLQTVIEELETSNEELQALNEELQATNEELQSSNEELETSNEELQSTNEELETVNEELQVKTQELGEANSDLNNVLKSVGFGLVVVDGRGRITRFTASAAEVFDILPDDIGRQILSVPALFTLPDLRASLRQVLEQGTAFEAKVETGDRVYRMRILPYKNGRERTDGAVLTFSDQTDVERANRQIQVLGQRNEAILQTAADAIVVTGATGDIEIFNQAAEHIFGFNRDEMIGRSLKSLAPTRKEAAGRAGIADFLKSNGDRLIGNVTRAVARNAAGAVIPITLAVSVHDGQEGRVYTAIIRDISEQVRLEDLNARLVEDLKRSNRELAEFAYIASHDLREPLRMVSSYGELIKSKFADDLPENAAYYIDTMISGCLRMNRLIRELLEYSRLERTEPDFQPVNLDRLIDENIRDLKVLIREQDAVVTAEDLPRVMGDSVRLKQLLQNLINNAIKFARPDVPPAISVKARDIPGNKDKVLIQVDDNGQGIEENMAEEVFKIFRRLHGQEVEGTGVGLAVCKKIVEIHGGRIWVDTKADPGARLCFTLPKAPAPGIGEQTAKEKHPKEQKP